ncbi:MAG: BglG family transcription antiterminator [Lachnospiraceae bacterium]|nr:BglG family transcription antiterminator [Lachnospiraceae bacterium]
MRDKHMALVKALMKQPGWTTARQLALQLQVSDRSVKNYIGEINYQEENLIEASKSGYRIDKERAKELLGRQTEHLPETQAERINYIIAELLTGGTDEGIDLFDVGEDIFVSYETLRKDMVKVRKKVKEYGLFASVSNSTVRLEGKELDKRKLLSAILYDEFDKNIVSLDLMQRAFPDFELEALQDIILTECKKNHYYVNDYAMLNLILDLAISMERIRRDCTFRTHVPENREFGRQETEMIGRIAKRIEEVFDIRIAGMELQELTALILSHLMQVDVNTLDREKVSTFVPPGSMAIVNRVLEYLNENYFIDTGDEEFVVKFAVHINNLLLRLENAYAAKNPLTDHIKKTCPLIFDCAVGAANCLNQMTGYRIDEDEIAYLALHIGGNLENYKQKEKTGCILLFPQYYDMSDIMVKKIRQEFSDSLLIQAVVTKPSELEHIKRADLIISTVDLSSGKWEHVVNVNPFLRTGDMEKIREKLREIRQEKKRRQLEDALMYMTSPELFSRNPPCTSQEQALAYMIHEMEMQGYVGSSFMEEVREREIHSTTAFGRLAVPHALELNAYKTGIYIMLSERPVEWEGSQINLILLFAINREDRVMFHEVFDNLIVLLLEHENMDLVLRSKSYPEFIDAILSCK